MRIRNLVQLTMLVLVLAVVTLACGADDGEQSVQGVILEVEAASITEVASFTLLGDDGEVFEFGIAPDAARDLAEGFLPGHLRGHALAAQEVTVFFREEGDTLLALRLVHD